MSLGPAPLGTVPDVVGQPQSAAQADITAAGFVARHGRQPATAPSCRWASSSARAPAAGTTATPGSAVSLVVSLGPAARRPRPRRRRLHREPGRLQRHQPRDQSGRDRHPGDGIDQNCNGRDSIAGDNTPPTASIDSAGGSRGRHGADRHRRHGERCELPALHAGARAGGRAAFTLIGSGTPRRSRTACSAGSIRRCSRTACTASDSRPRTRTGRSRSIERAYRVAGEMKVGVLPPVVHRSHRFRSRGIPITIVRTYDSRVKTQADFGIGWTLEISRGSTRATGRPARAGTSVPVSATVLPCRGDQRDAPPSHRGSALGPRVLHLRADALRIPASLTGGCEATAELPLRRRLAARAPRCRSSTGRT